MKTKRTKRIRKKKKSVHLEEEIEEKEEKEGEEEIKRTQIRKNPKQESQVLYKLKMVIQIRLSLEKEMTPKEDSLMEARVS